MIIPCASVEETQRRFRPTAGESTRTWYVSRHVWGMAGLSGNWENGNVAFVVNENLPLLFGYIPSVWWNNFFVKSIYYFMNSNISKSSLMNWKHVFVPKHCLNIKPTCTVRRRSNPVQRRRLKITFARSKETEIILSVRCRLKNEKKQYKHASLYSSAYDWQGSACVRARSCMFKRALTPDTRPDPIPATL